MDETLKTNPIAIDLFAGAGGLAEGLESAGIRIASAVELHPQPALTYAFNHPNTCVLAGDIHDLPMDVLVENAIEGGGSERIDLVVGGPPCQGFSSAGKKSASDPRNDLFRHFVRVVQHFRPRMVLMENVPGFQTKYDGKAYAEATESLSSLGYSLDDAVLDASHYGVPQRRQRFVLVGWLPGEAEPFSWPDRMHANGEAHTLFDELLPYPVTVAEALEDISFLEPGWEAYRHQLAAYSDFQRERRAEGNLLFNHLATRHREKAERMFSYIPEGKTINSVPPELRTGKRTMARLQRDSISNAVLALPDDLIHYRHNRIPTVREMARLQTFDDDFVFFGKRTSGFVERRVDVPQYTQVGNAVPPLLGKAIGNALVTSLGGHGADARDLRSRRARHSWVRGSSGFAGYVLDPEAQDQVNLKNVSGERLTLPTSEEEILVHEAEATSEWTRLANPRRGQWAPDVAPRSVPAYMPEPTNT